MYLSAPITANNYFCTINFTYSSDILYQSRTNEGFLKIEGIINPETYPNLRFSIARNLKHWYSFLKSCISFVKNPTIQNNYFKNNPELITKFGTEIIDLVEKSDLQDFGNVEQLLTSKVYEIKAYADYAFILDLLEKLKTQRGFARCVGIKGKIIKGFIQKLDYKWKNNILDLTLEEKFETDLLVLNYANGILTVNDVLYNLSGILNWYRITNEHFQAFDNNNIAICNLYRYNLVSLNGIIYATPNDLLTALNNF